MSLLIGSGIWMQPIAMALIVTYIGADWQQQAGNCLLLSLLPTVLILLTNNKTSPKEDVERPGALYPPMPKEFVRKEPEDGDIVIGKQGGKYVCRSVAEDRHYLIIGGSGSGKSSCLIIPTLLINQNTTAFVLDIKGELSAKATRAGSDNIRIFNPQDASTWGYDPMFSINQDSSEHEKFVVMQSIAFSLIPVPVGLKDPFWRNSARNLMIGLFLYYYRQGTIDFISITDEILSKPVAQTIETTMKAATPTSIEYKYLVQFSDMSEETLSGVFAEVANALTIFATDSDIRQSLGSTGRKINPKMLDEGYSIYLVIREEKLSAYYNLLQLIINQTLGELEKRPETSVPILFVIDELPRILSAGKIGHLLDASRTLRSRRVRLMLVTQSLEALMVAYSENEAVDLISNCSHKIILDASSSKTQKMVCGWAGKYKERRQSVSSGKQKSTTISYEEKDIVCPSDLMTLVKTGELVLISPHGYNRIDKCPYYSDSYFRPIAEKIREYNATISELHDKAKRGEIK